MSGPPIFLFSEAYVDTLLKILKPILILMFMVLASVAHSQKQLIMVKREDVILRLYPVDELIYKLKGATTVKTTYVNNLSDTAVVTHNDTIPFHRIDRIYFKQRKFYNTIGTFLVILGGGLLVIDQINAHVVQTQRVDYDHRFT